MARTSFAFAVAVTSVAACGPCCDGAGEEPAAAQNGRPGSGASPFPAAVKSLVLRRSTAVRLGPSDRSKRLGTVAKDVRVGFRRAATGPGCAKRWIEVVPRGWVCESFTRVSTQAPVGFELPELAPGERVPGIYGKVVESGTTSYRLEGGALLPLRVLEGSVTVRRLGESTFPLAATGEGLPVWRIGRDEYLPRASLRVHTPSGFRGVHLARDTGLWLPVAFAMGEGGAPGPANVYDAPGAAESGGQLPARAAVAVLDSVRDERGRAIAHRIGSGKWARAAAMRVAEPAPPPPFLRDRERWIDIDLDRQVLVAYEGAVAVYTTLISSGVRRHATETGIYRIWIKFAETDMSGAMLDEAPYSVATVPWTQFYAKDLALHAAYWHDRFGQPHSHGCINLSPEDARFLYLWSEPEVPSGWSMAHGLIQRPGSLVRVRSAADPDPPYRGYARRIYEARRARRSETTSSARQAVPGTLSRRPATVFR